MKLYHGTSKENKESILQNGFIESYGEYGNCVYLAVSKELAYDYGDELVNVDIDGEYLTYIDETFFNGRYEPSDLESIARKKDYKAVVVEYSECTSSRDEREVCVYDSSVIEIMR